MYLISREVSYIAKVLQIADKVSFRVYQLVDGLLPLLFGIIYTINDLLRDRLNPKRTSLL